MECAHAHAVSEVWDGVGGGEGVGEGGYQKLRV